MMTMDQQLPRTAPAEVTEHSAFASWWWGLTAWAEACADSYAASAMYEDLSRLSDAELRRRGLNRESLVRDVFMFCGRRD
jgi:hypothetical protein